MALTRRRPGDPPNIGGTAGPVGAGGGMTQDEAGSVTRAAQGAFPSPLEGPAGAPGPDLARGGETPRERPPIEIGAEEMGGGGPQLRSQSAPPRPGVPTPGAGGGGPIPFAPMPDPMNAGGFASRGRGGLFGLLGGLKGGGLGVPFDPSPNQASDPISGLLKLLGKI